MIRRLSVLRPDSRCTHCDRPLGLPGIGVAADGSVLCHTGTVPATQDPPDCYRLVTVYRHTTDGACCRPVEAAA